jgi:hypothetical protein
MTPIDTELALGGKIYWRDLALQLAKVWWELTEVKGELQHGDLDSPNCTFSVVLPHHGGRVFHGDTPMDSWNKAKRWLMSPDRGINELGVYAVSEKRQVKDTLHLYHRLETGFPQGVFYPDADHPGQTEAFFHFTGGCSSIAFHRLDEIVYIAGLHGWDVHLENDPRILQA